MPLFRKSASDHSVLSPCHRKVLQRCRMRLLKDLDVQEPLEALSSDEGFRQEIREQILAEPTRQQRVAALLDRLETRGEKAFSLFMESLREYHKQLFSVMEEAIRNIDEHDSIKQKERVSFTGEAIRKLLIGSKHRNFSSPDSESADELEINLDPNEADYIDCYSIPLRGRHCREPWVKHVNEPRSCSPEGANDTTFMATLVKDLVFRKVQWQDIPRCIKKPPQNCHTYVVDSNQSFFKKDRVLTREEEEEAADEEEALLQLEDPPPVPPKPEHLPPLAMRPPSLKLRKGESHERAIRSRFASEKPRTLPRPDKAPVSSVLTDDDFSFDSKESSSASETTLQPTEDPVMSPTSPPQTPPVPTVFSVSPPPTPPVPPRTDKPSVQQLPSVVPKSPPIPPRNGQYRPLSIVSEETRSLDSLQMGNQQDYTSPERALPHIHERLQNGETHPSENLYSVERDTEIYGEDATAETQDSSLVDEEGEMYEPITSPVERDPISQADQVDSNQDGETKVSGGSPTTKKLSLAESIAPLAEKDDELLDLPVGAEPEEDDLHDLEPKYDEAAGDDRKASADSLTGSSTPASMSTRSTATDSGIDAPATPTMSTTVPLNALSDASLSLPMRREKRSGSGVPLMLPRNLGDIEIFADPDTSEDNSYYEDIDAIGAAPSSPSGVSSGSYLDPKPFAQALDEQDFRQPWSSLKSSHLGKCIDHNWLDPPSRMLLKRGQLLVAETVEACPESLTPPTPPTSPQNLDTPGEASIGTIVESIKDFQCTHLAYDKYGQAFYLPKQNIRKYGDPEGEPWFYPIEMSSQQASLFLGMERQEGCFVVYRPPGRSSGAVYNLSVCRSNGYVVHYHILENVHGDVMVEHDDHSFMTLRDLVQYFQRNRGRLVTRLRRPLKEARLPITPGYHYDWKWEVNRSALNMTGQIIGKGHFGYVISGVYQKSAVAIKVLPRQEFGVMEEDDFLEEACMMMNVKHEHIVRLIGVSCLARPLLLITEYIPKGNLRDCLRNGTLPADNIDTLFDVCIQVTSALAYLESRQYMLHRDIAARNFLVTEDTCIKLADFGRARFVSDNYYQASKTEKIAIKWAAPEVLFDSVYSSKADVWSLGCVYWEVFSGGARPYSTLSGEQTAVYVIEGGRLEKPPGCSPDIFAIMRSCWRHNPDERHSASYLSEKLRSKSSIYYTTPIRPQSSSSSDKISVKSVPPSATSTLKAQRPTTPTSKANRLIYGDHKSEEAVKEIVEYRSDHSPALRLSNAEKLLPSSSETSLVSTSGNSTKDDLHRGHKIRKSLRNFMGKAKRKESKAAADMPERPDFRQSYGSTYGN